MTSLWLACRAHMAKGNREWPSGVSCGAWQCVCSSRQSTVSGRTERPEKRVGGLVGIAAVHCESVQLRKEWLCQRGPFFVVNYIQLRSVWVMVSNERW